VGQILAPDNKWFEQAAFGAWRTGDFSNCCLPLDAEQDTHAGMM
jgi:hypothetical protein